MKISPIWKLESKKFKQLIAINICYGHVLKFFGLKNHGNNCKTLKKRIEKEGIDDSHLKKFNKRQALENYRKRKAIPLKELLVKNSKISNRHGIKKKLISLDLLKNICNICGQGPEWYGKKLVFVLDHKNGINTDYRIENLRLLCPNCNSQTETFCGRTKKRTYNCNLCGRELKGEGKTGLCHSCLGKKDPFQSPQENLK